MNRNDHDSQAVLFPTWSTDPKPPFRGCRRPMIDWSPLGRLADVRTAMQLAATGQEPDDAEAKV